MNTLQGLGDNPGLTQQMSLTPGMPGFAPGALTVNSPLPALPASPAAFSFSLPQSLFTFVSGLTTTKPEMHTPYVQNWTLGIQRELRPGTVVEARYVGNKTTHTWRTYALHETNIFENGFLQEFRNAQRNLAINEAAGVSNSFANRG
jgi:hypothetical protein